MEIDRAFPILVDEMMSAQTEYFRTRSKNALERSMRLEGKVRRWLSHLLNEQPTLFDEIDARGPQDAV